MRRTVASLQSELFPLTLLELVNPELPIDDRLTEAFLQESPRLRLNYGATAQTLYEDSRALLSVHALDKNSAVVEKEIAKFSDMLLETVNESTRDRIGLIMSSAREKLLVTGKEHRLFSVMLKVLDTDLNTPITQGDTTWDGKGMKGFREFYHRFARVSVCANNRWLVRLQYSGRYLYGAFLQMAVGLSAEGPHMYNVNLVMYVTAVEGTALATEGDFDF